MHTDILLNFIMHVTVAVTISSPGLGRSTVNEHVLKVPRCSFMYTIHTDRTHLILDKRGVLEPLECSCHIVVEENSMAWQGHNQPANTCLDSWPPCHILKYPTPYPKSFHDHYQVTMT